MYEFGSRSGRRLYRTSLLAVLVAALLPRGAAAQTGTFIDRQLPTDLRVVSYNVLWDTIFPDRDAAQAAKFERVVSSLDADILNLQEIGDPFCGCTPKTAADVQGLLNTIAPLDGGETWHVHKGSDAVIASKYPLSMLQTTTIPEGDRSQAIALVDLPDAQFDSDFYFMNNHYKCCGNVGGSEDAQRQKQSDAIVNWLRDARTPGGAVNLPPGTPFAVVGDLNIVGGLQPLNTLIDGNIIDESTYGPDSLPDWDGSSLADLHPLHNATGPDDYTWRNDNSSFDPGRLDYVIYSDSALDVANMFVLNTVAMWPADRAATGLEQFDITVDDDGEVYDHLPLVVDFRLFSFAASDFNFSRSVDAADLAVWDSGYGTGSGASRSQGDADGDGFVDGGDFLLWQQQFDSGGLSLSGSTAIPEPSSSVLLLSGAWLVWLRRGRYANSK
jgi:endonuclease/exonuclease/phosphatase family metal-dependent hydrolase